MLSKVVIHLLIITLFILHHFSSQLGVGVVAAAAKCHLDDEAGLLAFKSGIKSDPSGMLLSWIPGTDCCSTWQGIGCSQPNPNRVNIINLIGQLNPDNSTLVLYGTISPSLSKLQYLQAIFLYNLRNLSGPFPAFLFNLPRLQYFSIVNSTLSGKLPENIGTRFSTSQLTGFNLERNRFSGTIPTSLGLLTHLTEITLSGNMFIGSIPYSIGNLNNLTSLSLDRNQLTGTIPDFFKGLTNLFILNLSHNKLSGNIPGSITATATTLQYLEVGHNALSGKIPEFLGRFNGIYRLDLSWNQFKGIVPNNFANLTHIFDLDLSHNSLVGSFPVMKVNGAMGSLDLSYNQFHLGQIPAWVTSSQIISLKLAKCGINIKLDDWKPIHTSLYQYIDLSENKITGSPVRILNRSPLDSLLGFYASGNKLNFNLQSMKISPTLKYLDLSRNLIFGKVPEAVSGLDILNVSNNHLCGQLPKTMFPSTAFLGNDCLCGSPLPQCKA